MTSVEKIVDRQTANASVLIVDDEDGVRRVEARVLERAGFRVLGARDGAEALEIADRNEPFDLVIADMAMPVMEGTRMADELRLRQPALKVLYVTACADRLFDDKPILAEDEAFLDKPFTAAGLIEAVSLLMTGRIPSQPNKTSPRALVPAALCGPQVQVWN